MDKNRYKQIVDKNSPKPDKIKNALVSFVVGGTLGALGELLLRGYAMWFELPRKEAGVIVILTLIILASVLTALGVFDFLMNKYVVCTMEEPNSINTLIEYLNDEVGRKLRQ